MNEKTVSYLEGRFGDYYRSTNISLPPEYDSREWGYIPWTEGYGEHMVRHLSHLNMGEDVYDFLARKRPRHMYFSATKYKQPGASTMDDKKWQSSDLVFDLDADPQHMDIIDSETDTYKDMLEKCKKPLENLLEILRNTFNFEDITIVFSGGRGYHVHVRDKEVQNLGRQERSEIVNYIYGRGLELEIGTQPNHLSKPELVYRTNNGWYGKVYSELCNLLKTIEQKHSQTREKAVQYIQSEYEFEKEKAEKALKQLEENKARIRAGNITAPEDSTLGLLIAAVSETVVESNKAEVDEPVTTDINRLIRLPGSLHGGSGLKVTPLKPDEVADFSPLVDAIPEKFKQFEIQINVTEETKVELDDMNKVYEEGEHTVPEFIGLYLMASGSAEKISES